MEDEHARPTTSELLDRLVRLEKRADDLNAKLEVVWRELQKASRVFGEFDDTLMHHFINHDAQFADAWARIKNVELTLFPNLAGDIEAVNRIVGEGENCEASQLDSRRRLPWTDKKNPSTPS